ncbi:MAG: hypothetical protein ACFFCZ_08875 [Promethearchaeota archaeon]
MNIQLETHTGLTMTTGPGIRAFLVFQSEAGTPFIANIYDPSLKVHPNLIVAFLTAIMGFARETVQADLTFLTLGSYHFYFIIKEEYKLIFAVLTSRLVASASVKFKLNTISSFFIHQYGETISNLASSASIDMNIFNEFNQTVDDILFGTTREIQTHQREDFEAQAAIVKSEMNLLGLGIYSFTGDLLVNLLSENLEEQIQELFPRMELYRWVIMQIPDALILFYPIKGEGLILILVASEKSSTNQLIEGARNLTSKIREIATRTA